MKAPFSVVSASEAEVDLDIDGIHVVGHEIDADVTTDDDGEGGSAFEVAVRVAEARSRMVRDAEAPEGQRGAEYVVDEDMLCRIDARARIEPKRVLVRRLSTYGAADLDPAEETGLGCDVAKTDKRYVELSLGHFAVGLPKDQGRLPEPRRACPRARAAPRVVNRLPGTPDRRRLGRASTSSSATRRRRPSPTCRGRIEAEDIRVDRFTFRADDPERVQRAAQHRHEPAHAGRDRRGRAEIRDIEVQPARRRASR